MASGIQRIDDAGNFCDDYGCRLVVRATYNYRFLLLSYFLDARVLDVTAQMRFE